MQVVECGMANLPSKPNLKGFAGLSLGQDPGRFETFLADNPQLDGATEMEWQTIWRMTTDERPDLRERVLRGLTSQETNRSGRMLFEVAQSAGSWEREDNFSLILERAGQIDQETLDEVVYGLTIHTLNAYMAEDGAVPKALLSTLLTQYGQYAWVQGRAGSSQAGMGYDLVQMCTEQLHTHAISGETPEELRAGGERGLGLLLASGCTLDRAVVVDDFGAPLLCASALHLACYLEDNEPTHDAVAIELLVNFGADVDLVLNHRNAPRGAGRDALLRHPKMKSRELAELAGLTSDGLPKPLRM